MDTATAMLDLSTRTICRCDRCKPAWLRIWDALLYKLLDERATTR